MSFLSVEQMTTGLAGLGCGGGCSSYGALGGLLGDLDASIGLGAGDTTFFRSAGTPRATAGVVRSTPAQYTRGTLPTGVRAVRGGVTATPTKPAGRDFAYERAAQLREQTRVQALRDQALPVATSQARAGVAQNGTVTTEDVEVAETEAQPVEKPALSEDMIGTGASIVGASSAGGPIAMGITAAVVAAAAGGMYFVKEKRRKTQRKREKRNRQMVQLAEKAQDAAKAVVDRLRPEIESQAAVAENSLRQCAETLDALRNLIDGREVSETENMLVGLQAAVTSILGRVDTELGSEDPMDWPAEGKAAPKILSDVRMVTNSLGKVQSRLRVYAGRLARSMPPEVAERVAPLSVSPAARVASGSFDDALFAGGLGGLGDEGSGGAGGSFGGGSSTTSSTMKEWLNNARRTNRARLGLPPGSDLETGHGRTLLGGIALGALGLWLARKVW